jgi:hypothetical protein
MTESDLKKFFPYASKSTFARNAGADSQAPSPKSQRAVRDEPLAAPARKESYLGRVVVRVKSFRCRLLDPDNLCPKYLIDGLRHAGLIRDDSPQDIILEVSQEKVATRKEEYTRIEIEPIATTPNHAMTRAELIEAYWANCGSSWNRPAFDVFMETMDEETLRQYIQMGTT